jgi:hypothetical protein
LRLVVLRCHIAVERFGAPHHVNYTKIGLSRAHFVPEEVSEERMPTVRCAAALRWLLANNRYVSILFLLQIRVMPFFCIASSLCF